MPTVCCKWTLLKDSFLFVYFGFWNVDGVGDYGIPANVCSSKLVNIAVVWVDNMFVEWGAPSSSQAASLPWSLQLAWWPLSCQEACVLQEGLLLALLLYRSGCSSGSHPPVCLNWPWMFVRSDRKAEQWTFTLSPWGVLCLSLQINLQTNIIWVTYITGQGAPQERVLLHYFSGHTVILSGLTLWSLTVACMWPWSLIAL